ncbi:serine protease inhibitor I/II-like [Euwallacea fornicatus]|uniref:serine protease inhibitor I/II-like n=1 Tax=Euwallacea fornicatus TaxID=995702 RepID=UPI00338D736A
MARLAIFVCLLFVVVISAQSASNEECTPGEVKKEDCNTCSCVSTGRWVCTKIRCSKKREVSTKTCVNGQTTSLDNGCNTCVCSNQIWICTQKFCV